jgi:hypothetical protein
MSEAKNKFYQHLVPRVTALGFSFKKSKNSFERIVNDIQQVVVLRWDGRGGTTVLDLLEIHIKSISINKAVKEYNPVFAGMPHCYDAFGYIGPNYVKIPVMYSKKTLDLANDMNLATLAKLPFEEKYPSKSIQASADFVFNLFTEKTIPSLNVNYSETEIYEKLLQKTKTEIQRNEASAIHIFLLYLYAKKLQIALPDTVKNYDLVAHLKEWYPDNVKLDFEQIFEYIKACKFD